MDAPDTILIVDDEPFSMEFLHYKLEQDGYKVYTCDSGRKALDIAARVHPGMILLDIIMPGMDGVETCIELRKIGALRKTFIAFLTARSEDYTQIAGFEAGADDYIMKPVRISVLLSRIRAHFRKMKKGSKPRLARFGDIMIDLEKHEVKKGKKVFRLNRKEFMILRLLAKNPGRMHSAREIYTSVWGSEHSVNESTIRVHISRIRNKLGSGAIRSYWKDGYSLE